MSDPLDTAFTRAVGCRLPIVQTGMGWVSGGALTASTSAAGGFGVLAGATLDRGAMAAAMDRVRARTDRPFGVNLRPDQTDLAGRLDDVAARGLPVVSFAGPPDRATIARLQAAGLKVMVTIGAPRHAAKMCAAGVDLLIAQGAEGGGHTGAIPTAMLLPAVLRTAGATPVLAAGGMRDGDDLARAVELGAAGVAMGTRFLLTAESRVPDAVKQRYLQAAVGDTIVTTALDGAPQRVLRTSYVDELAGRGVVRRLLGAGRAARRFSRLSGTGWPALLREGWSMWRTQDLSALQVALAATTPTLTRAALVDGDLAAGVLPAGEVAGLIDDLPTVAELIGQIEAVARERLQEQQAWT